MGPTDLGSMVEAIRRRPMLVRFFLMGLLNNVTYVIMIAGSPEIAAESIGLVYFLAVAPAIVVKVSSQFWFDKVSYWWRTDGLRPDPDGVGLFVGGICTIRDQAAWGLERARSKAHWVRLRAWP